MKRTLSALTLCSVLVSFDSSALFCVNCASFTQMMTSNLNQAQSYVEEVQ
ncbi:P-type conjugative transfer protein TrbJ, partial [Vibrio parahaemolyticus]